MAYSIAPAFAADCNFALRGTINDIVSGNDCAVTGTVTASADADGDYIVASASSGLKTPGVLPRLTRASGGLLLARFKYSGTGAMAICGVGETGTATIESVLLNTGSNAGVSNGNGAFYLRATTGGNARCGYTTGRALNDGAVHTIAFEIPELEGGTAIGTINCAIDGVAYTLAYNPNTTPIIAAGNMEFQHGVLARNLRGTLDTFAVGLKLYMLARMSGGNGAYDLAALTADPYQVFSNAVSGSINLTDAPDVTEVVGRITARGSIDLVDAPDVLEITGETPAQAIIELVDDPDVVEVVGRVTARGSIDLFDAPDILDLAGEAPTVVRAGDVPETGASGGSFLRSNPLFPADPDAAVSFTVTRWPTNGDLDVDEYGTFTYDGLTDYFEYVFWVDGISDGVTYRVDLVVDVEEGVSGAINLVDAPDILVVQATAAASGEIILVDAPDLVEVVGSVPARGVIALTDTPDALQIVGRVRAIGTISLTDAPDLVEVIGSVPARGVIALTDAPDAFELVGRVRAVGTINLTDAPDVLTLTGHVGGGSAAGAIHLTDAPDVVEVVGHASNGGESGAIDLLDIRLDLSPRWTISLNLTGNGGVLHLSRAADEPIHF